MKIRKGFVTNSSSSSFIIAMKEEIPQDFLQYFTPLTKENLLKTLMNECLFDYYDKESITSNLTEEQEKNLLNVNDDVYLLLKLAIQDSSIIETYLKILNYFEKNDKPLYLYEVDWDWEFYHEDLRNFVRKQDIIYNNN